LRSVLKEAYPLINIPEKDEGGYMVNVRFEEGVCFGSSFFILTT